MNQVDFETPDWYEALTLDERSQFAGAAIATGAPGAADAAGVAAEPLVNQELAQKRLQRWRSQSPFNNDVYFAERLRKNRLTESDFIGLLGEPSQQLQQRFRPAPSWLSDLERLYTQWASRQSVGQEQEVEDLGFLFIAKPLILDGRERLRAGIEQLRQLHQHVPFDAQTAPNFFLPHLYMQLSQVASRTMVLELNVARVEERLRGDTSEERFQDFIRQLRMPATSLAILREYPVLARQLKRCVDYWARNSLEFLRHLCVDWEELRSLLSPEQDPGALTGLKGGAGDTHREGRSVMIAEFASGFRVVYKPHSLAVDQHFGALLEWLNQRGEHPPFRIVKTLERGSYGWVEFVTAHGCETPEQVRIFYERLGALLALLYVLDAIDFHHENLLAAGAHPVLIDLEALFHPRVNSLQASPSLEFMQRTITQSVLRIGLLPQRIWVNEEGEGLDLSGMGGAEGQLTPFTVLATEQQGTDQMRFTRKRVEFGISQNRPTLSGVNVKLEDHTDHFIKGFTEMYRLVVRHREELLAVEGPIGRFACDEVRLIARATKIYAQVLQESFHPNVLRSALDRDRLLDRLWAGIENRPEMARLIPAEQADLQKGDIPFFATWPASRHLWTSSGELIEDFLSQTSLEVVWNKLRSLSDDDLSRQLWFIRSSLATTSGSGGHALMTSTIERQEEAVPAGPQELLAAAREIGDRLEETASRGHDLIAWTGLTMVKEKTWSITPVTGDLYGGLTGIGLFLAYLGRLTGDDRFTQTARLAINTALRQFKEGRALFADAVLGIGAFSGESGLIYGLTHLGQIWREPALHEQAEEMIGLLQDSIAKDRTFDILGGAAGYLCALSSFHEVTGSSVARQGAVACAEHLLTSAQTAPQGIAWNTMPSQSHAPLTGFSHGVSGVAYALLRAGALTGEERFYEGAAMAIAYERTQFIPDQQNWRDLRRLSENPPGEGADESQNMIAWCHGAPGIGLSRLYAAPLLNDPEIGREIDIALETTVQKGFGGAHCLCHGDAGNLELLIEASGLPGYEQWKATAMWRAGWLLNVARRHGWLCSTPKGVETPGLMLGLSGIGYGLLRLADPGFVPSILTLQPPRRNK
jgi:class II lanthipeptide synthase